MRTLNTLTFGPLNQLVAGLGSKILAPATEIREDKEKISITVEIPGLKKEDISIQIEDLVLTVSGEKKTTEETKEGEYVRSEIYYGKFTRSIGLPPTVDTDSISANYEAGTLKLTVNKKPEVLPKSIAVS